MATHKVPRFIGPPIRITPRFIGPPVRLKPPPNVHSFLLGHAATAYSPPNPWQPGGPPGSAGDRPWDPGPGLAPPVNDPTTGQAGPGPGPPGHHTPTYEDLIANDPLWRQTQADLAAQGIQNAAQRKAAIDRLIVQYGMAPAAGALGGLNQQSLGFLNADVDAATRAMADANTKAGLSLVARLLDQHNRNQTAITDQLAERGIYRSGATPSMIGHEGLQYKQAGADTLNQVLDSVMGAINGYLTAQAEIQAQLRQGAADAAARAQAQLGSGTAGGGTTTTSASGVGTYPGTNIPKPVTPVGSVPKPVKPVPHFDPLAYLRAHGLLR